MGLDAAAPVTTFVLPPAHGHTFPSTATQSSSSPPGTPLKPNPSILNRLGRRLSQSKTQLVRRVSLGARTPASPTSPTQKCSPTTMDAAEPVSDAPVLVGPRADARDHRSPTPPVATAQTTKGAGGLGLRRSLKALGRSRSEGTAPAVKRPREALDREIAGAKWRAAASWRAAVEYGGQAECEGGTPPPQLLWEERLGLCWDGREQVLPDSHYEPYNSNSDELPSRVVYASTLSTFPPRPPLVARPSLPPTPASLVIAEYRARYPLLSPSHSSPSLSDDFLSTAETSASATPIPTPRPRPTGDHHRTGSVRSLASEVSSSEVPRFASASRSEDSNTSLESMRDDDKPVVRFALVDDGPVARPPDPPVEQRRGRVKWTDFTGSDVDACEELESEGSDPDSEDWYECE